MKKIQSSYRLQSEKHAFLKTFMSDDTIDIFMDEVKKEAEHMQLLAKKAKKKNKKTLI